MSSPRVFKLLNQEICEQEKILIKALCAQHPDIGYNICRGGEGFTGPHSEISKRKTSKSLRIKGHKPTLEATIKSIYERNRIYREIGSWPGSPFKDMKNVVINGITALTRVKNDKDGNAFWLCRCHCGREFVTAGSSIRIGHTKNCGCLKKQQNLSNLHVLERKKGV